MIALILHPDPEVSARLEQDYLIAGAMVFKSGNSPNTQHYEVSNPHHHAALIYLKYNTEIFGPGYAQKLSGQAVASLVLDADVLIVPEDLTGILSIGVSVADAMGIPVVKSVVDVFSGDVYTGVDSAAPREDSIGGLWCSGCEISGGNLLTPETCDKACPDCRFFTNQEEALCNALSDSSISELEVRGVPWYSASDTYQPGQPAIKLGAIIFPGGVID